MVLTFGEEKILETMKHQYKITEEKLRHNNKMEEIKLFLKVKKQNKVEIDIQSPKTDTEFLMDMDERR